MKRLNQSGSHIVAFALLLLVLGVVGFTGYTVMQHNKKTLTTTATGTKLAVPTAIQSKADLSATAKSLDDSSSDLNSSVDGSSLDSSMNNLL